MKKLTSMYKRYMFHPILYKTVTRTSIVAVLMLLWQRYVSDGTFTIWEAPGFLCGVVLLIWAWVDYLRLDGVTIHHLLEEFKGMGKRQKKIHSTRSIIDYADEKIVSFEELEPEERTYCSLLSNLVLGLPLGVLLVAIVLWLVPAIPLNLFTALIVIVFGFFFATVSSRMVGLIGSSNNPVSGMAIATLLISTMLLKATGTVGIEGMTAAIVIGGIICVIAAIAGDTSQDLKTGYLLGATPVKQQIGELIGVAVSSVAIGAILYLLSMAWGGYGSDALPAPQATLMKMIVEGVMGGNLPWNLVFTGVFLAIALEILRIPVMPFAIGLYLPIYLNTSIMIGGVVRWFMDSRKNVDAKLKEEQTTRGTLFCAGMIAGEGLVGILLAVFAVFGISTALSIDLGNIGGVVLMIVMIACLLAFSMKKKKN